VMLRYSNILVATDFSPNGEYAARRAAEIAKASEATLVLLHVIDYFPEDIPIEVVAPEDQDPAAYLEAYARDKLTEMSQRIGQEDAVALVNFSTHSARHEFAHVAQRQGADLIVVGNHGQRGVAEHLGSTAAAVIHDAKCDVLIVRNVV